ncbi:MAG: histidine phosphatase family protein [Actinobacteria bacterium]|nr:histidine phosphatase family protein [Actinomycetota bacterium]
MTTLLLARHGETDWNRDFRIQGSSDIALNDLGRAQAHGLTQELEDVELDAIYASDLSRARATAEAVAASHGLEVRLDPRLRERSFGSWEGLTREDIAALPEGARHDGESDEEVRERVLEAVQAIADAHPGEQVLVVSHGGALNTLWHHALGERVERWANCAVYKLALRDGAFLAVD